MSMLSHSAKKARLTFKLELDELWINTGKKFKSIHKLLLLLISGNNEKNSNDTYTEYCG
jgi:hypothetical protein